MSTLLDLIDSRIKQSDIGIKTMPCTVLELLSDQFVKVTSISNGENYTVLNMSGSNVEVGETVQVAYTGNLITSKNAYIIASKNKSSEAKYRNLTGDVYTGALFETMRPIVGFGIKAMSETDCVLHFSCNIASTETGTIEFEIDENDYSPKFTIEADTYKCISFDIPLTLSGDENEIWVNAKGVGIVTDACAFVGGHGIESYDLYDDTGDNDYIYNTIGDTSNVIYYIGNSTRPRMPLTLSNKAIDKIYATAFNYSNVQSVYIPEGITEIE